MLFYVSSQLFFRGLEFQIINLIQFIDKLLTQYLHRGLGVSVFNLAEPILDEERLNGLSSDCCCMPSHILTFSFVGEMTFTSGDSYVTFFLFYKK